MMAGDVLSLYSPAKTNLFLRITKKRDDGFHELASVFQAPASPGAAAPAPSQVGAAHPRSRNVPRRRSASATRSTSPSSPPGRLPTS
jgi:hypothetical protein